MKRAVAWTVFSMRRFLCVAVPWFAVAITGSACPAAQPPSDADPQTIYRIDITAAKVVPIPREELKVGYVYNHFSPRLDRRVWSYYKADGTFWNAFGEGTTFEAWILDVRATPEQRTHLLEQYPELVRELETTGGRVFVELGRDDQWKLAGTGISSIIFERRDRRAMAEGRRQVHPRDP